MIAKTKNFPEGSTTSKALPLTKPNRHQCHCLSSDEQLIADLIKIHNADNWIGGEEDDDPSSALVGSSAIVGSSALVGSSVLEGSSALLPTSSGSDADSDRSASPAQDKVGQTRKPPLVFWFIAVKFPCISANFS